MSFLRSSLFLLLSDDVAALLPEPAMRACKYKRFRIEPIAPLFRCIFEKKMETEVAAML